MIERKKKRCKGQGKAKGFGCNELTFIHRYGLGLCCFGDWLYSHAGKETLQKSIIIGKKKAIVDKKKKDRAVKMENNCSGYMKLADMYFSRFIRLQYSENGYCTCYTCGSIKPIKEVDNGHYQKREYKAVRYDVNNCRPQCKTCNGDTKHNGKQVEFRINLINEVGIEEVERIEAAVKKSNKYTTSFYKEKSDHYRIETNELQKELGIKYW